MSPKRDQSGKGATRTKPDSRLQLHDAMGFTILKTKYILWDQTFYIDLYI